jgi:hypothetical protein
VEAGSAAEVLPFSLNNPLPLLRTHPPSLLVCCFFVLAEMGATSTASGRLEVNLLLSEKRGRKSHFGIILVSFASGIRKFCMASRSLLPMSTETKQDLREPVLLMA